MKWIYKIAYPTGKIYIGKDSLGSYRYTGSGKGNRSVINADFEKLPEDARRSFSIGKEILWQSETASESELATKEVEFIRLFRSNDPAIGYNQWPKLNPKKPISIRLKKPALTGQTSATMEIKPLLIK
jgi:hypothetical protein